MFQTRGTCVIKSWGTMLYSITNFGIFLNVQMLTVGVGMQMMTDFVRIHAIILFNFFLLYTFKFETLYIFAELVIQAKLMLCQPSFLSYYL